MRKGTPGFSGARLREAREARGMTAVSLASLVGVSPQAISQYEHPVSTPGPAVLGALAEKLQFPISFFTLPDREQGQNTVFYRSMSAATKQARTRAKWKLQWLQDVTEALGGYLEFPTPNLPDVRLSNDPLLISDDEVEGAAEDTRAYWGLGEGPIGNMVSLVENQGVIVTRDQLGSESLDSLSKYDDQGKRPYILVGTDKGSAVRWRFDIAHELGHLLLHSNIDNRLFARPEIFKRVEAQANRFAAAFLIPQNPFADEFFAASLDVLRTMKPKWKVSISLMIIRAKQTGLISEDVEKRLWMGFSRNRWRREEPFDSELPAEVPRMLSRAIEMLLSSGVQTTDDLLSNLHLSASDIERITGLPDEYLSGDFTQVRMIERRTETTPLPDRPPAEVIKLPLRRKK
jgi:Zn-dependent peptidase ImmA (M78 family)/transcriptional regulator with XRE-family HTH domain